MRCLVFPLVFLIMLGSVFAAYGPGAAPSGGSSSSTSSGGGGGGGGGGVPSPVSDPFGQHSLSLYGIHYFKVDDVEYKLRIREIREDGVSFFVQSEISLTQGESKPVDVNGDGIGDVTLELVSFSLSTATFNLQLLAAPPTADATGEDELAVEAERLAEEIVDAPQATGAVVSDTNNQDEEKVGTLTFALWVIVAFVVLIGGAFFMYVRGMRER